MIRALESLHALGALDADARLSQPMGTRVRRHVLRAECGRRRVAAALPTLPVVCALPTGTFCLATFAAWPRLQMADLPLDPALARMLLAAGEMGCTAEVLTVVAMLSVQSVWAPGGRREVDEAKARCAGALSS